MGKYFLEIKDDDEKRVYCFDTKQALLSMLNKGEKSEAEVKELKAENKMLREKLESLLSEVNKRELRETYTEIMTALNGKTPLLDEMQKVYAYVDILGTEMEELQENINTCFSDCFFDINRILDKIKDLKGNKNG